MHLLNPPAKDVPQASLVIEHRIPNGKGLQFRWWHMNLMRTARQCEGYIRTDLCPPVRGSQLRWYSIVHFDTAEHLNQWLKSVDREKMIASGQTVFQSYQFKSFATGLEGWFSAKDGTERVGLGPPAWKQNLAVVVGLYPTVMLQGLLIASLGIMKHWSPANAMLVNNLMSSSILTWAVMPLVTRLLGFWLQPAYQPLSMRTDILGTAIILVSLGLMTIVFNSL